MLKKKKLCFIILHFLTCNFNLLSVALCYWVRSRTQKPPRHAQLKIYSQAAASPAFLPDMTQPCSFDIMCVCSACAVRGSWDNSFMPPARKHMCSVNGKCRAVTCLLNVLCTRCQHFFPKEAVDQRCLWSVRRAHRNRRPFLKAHGELQLSMRPL